jgi:hypothetical protein
MKENYRIITAANNSELTKRVNEALAEGFKAQGGPVVYGQATGTMWTQAIVKK